MNGHYHRSSKGGGEWEFFDLPEQWSIYYKELTFNLKPFSFKHTGLFPEQAANWDWFGDRIRNAGRPIKVLNLFAYTGGATLAAAAAGASVTHVDASKGMVAWAKENSRSSGLENAPIRWIVDDCVKFVEREIRRGNHYDGIIMDRPRTERRDLEDRNFDLPVRAALHETVIGQPALLPHQLLHHRAGAVRPDLYALNRSCLHPRRHSEIGRAGTSGYPHRTGITMRCIRTLGIW